MWLRVHSKFIIPRQLLRSPIAGVILKANMHRKLDAVDVSIRILASVLNWAGSIYSTCLFQEDAQ